MKIHRTIPIVSAALALTLAVPLTATQDDVIVNFGDPVTLAGAGNQVVVPDEVSIGKDGTVTFVVNGPGHGIAIYPVSDKTTRDDITAQLCAHDQVTGACIDATFPQTARHIDSDRRRRQCVSHGDDRDDHRDAPAVSVCQVGPLSGYLHESESLPVQLDVRVRDRW